MSLQIPTSRRNAMREILDGDTLDEAALSANLREIRLINRGLGWTTLSLHLISRLVQQIGCTHFSYLDVATGSADLPVALVKSSRRHSWTVEALGLDRDPAVLAVASVYSKKQPVSLHQGDAQALPFPDRSVDVVTCALALHHFAPDEAAQVLREIARVARKGWLVVDVERSLPAYLGALALRHVLRSAVTRQDAPASVLRAYTLAELRTLLDQAGLAGASAGRRFPFRLVAASHPL